MLGPVAEGDLSHADDYFGYDVPNEDGGIVKPIKWRTATTSALLMSALAGCAAQAAPEATPTQSFLSTFETCSKVLDASIEFQSASGNASTMSASKSALAVYVLRTDNIANQSEEPLRSQLILRAGPFRNPDFDKGFVVTDEEQAAKDAFDATCESAGVTLTVN